LTRDFSSASTGPTSGPVLSCSQLSFSYGTVDVLRDVDLEVQAGESIALMGGSGVGKSTLLHLLAGLLKPTRGAVHWHTSDVAKLKPAIARRMRREHLGLVLQFGDLLSELTLQENVELPLLLLSTPRTEARIRAAQALAELGLVAEAARHDDAVSGGQQQRAAVARALVHRPTIVLGDEVTGSLDVGSADVVLDAILGHAAEGSNVCVLSTHSIDVARRCDRILTLDTGTLREGPSA
jgi:putative ABC transport system ATP-binding protein